MSQPTEPHEIQPILLGCEPQLCVRDIERACDFYTSKLGFVLAFSYGEPPFYAQVGREAARINLRLVPGAVFAEGVRERDCLLSATITLAGSRDVQQLFQHFQAAGVTFQQPLRTEPWGAITFVIQDPDGNLILFGGAST